MSKKETFANWQAPSFYSPCNHECKEGDHEASIPGLGLPELRDWEVVGTRRFLAPPPAFPGQVLLPPLSGFGQIWTAALPVGGWQRPLVARAENLRTSLPPHCPWPETRSEPINGVLVWGFRLLVSWLFSLNNTSTGFSQKSKFGPELLTESCAPCY